MAQVAVASALGSLLSTKSSDYPKYEFSFTPFLRANGLAALVSDVPVCETYASNGNCPLGRRCPKRHPTKEQPAHHHYGRSNDNYVCKHWLKGLCKKGDACDFLHEYNLRKMSECEFYKSNGYCQNGDECLYVHVKEDSKLPICEDYNKGFCEKGPRCGKRHVRRKLCEFFMAGFCPDGPECKNGVHLKSLTGRQGEVDDEKQRKGRVADLERREEDQRKEFGWKGRRGRGGGGGGRWRDKKDRDRR